MPKQRQAEPGEINYHAFDRFTAVHFMSGVGLGLTPLPMWSIALMAVGWEIVENPLKDNIPKAFPHPTHDSKINAVVDVAAVMTGAVVARLGRGLSRGLGVGASLFGSKEPNTPALTPTVQTWPRPGRRALVMRGFGLIWPMRTPLQALTIPETKAWLSNSDKPVDILSLATADFALSPVLRFARERNIAHELFTNHSAGLSPSVTKRLTDSYTERFINPALTIVDPRQRTARTIELIEDEA